MRLYTIRCPRCGWKPPLPVDARVADGFRKARICRDCYKNHKVEIPFIIRETISVGQYLPHKDNN